MIATENTATIDSIAVKLERIRKFSVSFFSQHKLTASVGAELTEIDSFLAKLLRSFERI